MMKLGMGGDAEKTRITRGEGGKYSKRKARGRMRIFDDRPAE